MLHSEYCVCIAADKDEQKLCHLSLYMLRPAVYNVIVTLIVAFVVKLPQQAFAVWCRQATCQFSLARINEENKNRFKRNGNERIVAQVVRRKK